MRNKEWRRYGWIATRTRGDAVYRGKKKRQARAEGEKHNVVSRETSHGCGAAMVMNIPERVVPTGETDYFTVAWCNNELQAVAQTE